MHKRIAFMSKGFSDAEHNYQIHNKEMLAIMCALDEWHHFLEGTTEKFEILMDHRNLTYFQDAQKLNRQQAHWSLFLLCCRWDNGSVCDPPIYAGFGPQNITVIMSQESHYWNAFFDQNPFSTSSKIWQLWVILYIVGKVWMRRLQCCWNRRKRFSIGGEIPGTSLANVNLRGGIDSGSLSGPLGGLNCDVRLPEMLP